jgi:hypothetical protein
MGFNINLLMFNRNYYYYYITVIGLTPGGSSMHLHINSTQNTEGGTHTKITRGKKQLQGKNNNYKKKNWEVNWEYKTQN